MSEMVAPSIIENSKEFPTKKFEKGNKHMSHEDMVQNSLILSNLIKLPKLLNQAIEFIVFITNRTQNDLLTEFIVNELECYLCDYDTIILSIVEKSGFIESLKVGLNQYFGENFPPSLEKDNRYKTESLEYETVNLELNLPKKLFNFMEKYCKISNISKEEFITVLIITRLSYICSSPEIILNYIKKKDDFFEDLKEGVKSFYKNTITKRKH